MILYQKSDYSTCHDEIFVSDDYEWMDVYKTRTGDVYGSLDITGCVLAAVIGGMIPDLRYEVDDL